MSEEQQYFDNEEKVIKNHLKLNIGLHLLQILMFLLALYAFDWTHIDSEVDGNLYHVMLLSAHTESWDGDWLFNISEDCFTSPNELDHEPYPNDLCSRVGTLSMAGFFV